MSYRSIKRALGETSLERKCRFLFGACLLLLITGSFWWYGQQTEELVYKQNRTKGQLLVNPILIKIHWDSWAENEPSYNMPEKFTGAAEQLSEELLAKEYSWSFLRAGNEDSANNPQTAADRVAFETLLKDPSIEFLNQFSENQKQYFYYQPIRQPTRIADSREHQCRTCHFPPSLAGQDNGLSLPSTAPALSDDLIAVVKIQFSNEPIQDDLNRNRAILLSTAFITVALAMLASYLIVRYVIVKPLKHLRDVSDAVSHGNIDQRAEIRTADEFQELGEAFNRMLRHLVATQGELRVVNGDLDTKVDELAQMNMRLFEMNRLKSDFLATMSHELRTPLNSIIGFSDVLGNIKSLDDKQKRYVQNIQKSGKMLLDMINDILDLARIESGKMEVRPTDFRIEHIVGAQCDMARPLSEKKNIDLEIEIEPNLPEVRQDQSKVQQILTNLLSNAIKFTPEGGRIVVTARRAHSGELLLMVADTGVGIADEDQTNVFERFRQGNTVLPSGDAMTREYSGTGLGLSIVKELCKLLGGEISLKSELGKGSIFTVRLPWELSNQPALDSNLTESLDNLTKPRRADYDRLIHRGGTAAAVD